MHSPEVTPLLDIVRGTEYCSSLLVDTGTLLLASLKLVEEASLSEGGLKAGREDT